jgi:hypothetical protein
MRVLLFLVFAALVFADGGAVVFRGAAGPFDVAILSKSDAIRVGPNDLSVMVQKGQTNVTDASVQVHFTRNAGGEIERLTALATHAKATNKTLYAATLNMPSPGLWRLSVDVSAAGEKGTAADNIHVLSALSPAATYWPYIAMVPFAALAFVLNRWLRKKMGVGRYR